MLKSSVQIVGGFALMLQACSPHDGYECYKAHVAQAMRMNWERAPLYAAATEGRSRWVSYRLIAAEAVTYVSAAVLELLAEPAWEQGIPVLCAEFVSMATTPAFIARINGELPAQDAFQTIDVDAVKSRVNAAHDTSGYAAAHQALSLEIERVAGVPHHHCMLRHLLESAARSAYLAPQFARRAKGHDFTVSPELLARVNFKMHLAGLGLADALDVAAAPLQSDGVPILCQDVPPIPIAPELN